jgi:hypothetical protein
MTFEEVNEKELEGKTIKKTWIAGIEEIGKYRDEPYDDKPYLYLEMEAFSE